MAPRSAIGPATVALLVVEVILVGYLGYVLEYNNPLASNLVGATSSVLSTNGIQLTVSINATTLATGRGLRVSVSIFNTLPRINDVHASNAWPFHGVPIPLWPECFGSQWGAGVFARGGEPAAVAILNGIYDLQTLHTVLTASYGYTCTAGGFADHIIFQPSSSQIDLTGIFGGGSEMNQTLGPFQMSLSFTTAGYWDLQTLSRELNTTGGNGFWSYFPQYPSAPTLQALHAFISGEYTIAVADEWGQAVILHLTVTSGQHHDIFINILLGICSKLHERPNTPTLSVRHNTATSLAYEIDCNSISPSKAYGLSE
jgi:hypothetical protein